VLALKILTGITVWLVLIILAVWLHSLAEAGHIMKTIGLSFVTLLWIDVTDIVMEVLLGKEL
jgi:hypothetical protein